MSSYTLYDASITVAKDALNALSAVVAKAEASPAGASIGQSSIHADMKPFRFQINTVTGTINKMVARLTGAEPKDLEDNLETIDAMKTRIAEIQKVLDGVTQETVNGREGETVPVGLGPGKPDGKLKSWEYVHGYAVPNIYFHLVTAYNIVRKEGGDIGKMDYLSPFLSKFLAGQF